MCDEDRFRDIFLEGKNRRDERKLMKNVSLEDEISVQNYGPQINTILPGFRGGVPDLATTMRERLLRLGFSDFGDYACVKVASILAVLAVTLIYQSPVPL